MMDKPLWTPPDEMIQDSQMKLFMETVNKQHHLQLNTYPDLHHWSVENSEDFWNFIWETCDVIGNKSTRELNEAKLNFAENLLQRRDEQPAILFANEQGDRSEISFKTLYQRSKPRLGRLLLASQSPFQDN